MLVLKQQLKEARIPQAVGERAVQGSEATRAQVVDQNAWPRPHPGRVRRPRAVVRGSQRGYKTERF